MFKTGMVTKFELEGSNYSKNVVRNSQRWELTEKKPKLYEYNFGDPCSEEAWIG